VLSGRRLCVGLIIIPGVLSVVCLNVIVKPGPGSLGTVTPWTKMTPSIVQVSLKKSNEIQTRSVV
jgi:hypothetical protein